MQAVAYIMKQ